LDAPPDNITYLPTRNNWLFTSKQKSYRKRTLSEDGYSVYSFPIRGSLDIDDLRCYVVFTQCKLMELVLINTFLKFERLAKLSVCGYAADVVAFVVVVAGPTVWTAGGTHEPFSADSCGQY
jgi:hypothetical protein